MPKSKTSDKAYRILRPYRQRLFLLAALLSAAAAGDSNAAQPKKIVALGDSLTAGYGLPPQAAFPAVLESRLKALGHDDEIINAGVSGDTTAGGLARLEWTLKDGADGMILELGANDMFRGVDPEVTKANLSAIIEEAKRRNIKVLLAGMQATPSLGHDYVEHFNAIYPELSAQYHIPLYPFFMEGVFEVPSLQLADKTHPNAEGVVKIVDQILPYAEKLSESLGSKP